MKPQADYRATNGLQLRAGKGRTVAGCFTAYGIVSTIDDWFQEVITPFCFADAIKAKTCAQLGDVAIKCLYQHNVENVLGSMKSGTFRLEETEQGLLGECDLPNHALGDQIAESMQRGDLDEASIGFYPIDTEWLSGKDMDIIKITRADLKEGSIANYPKTQSTHLGLRALSALKIEDENKKLVCRALNRYAQSKLSPDDQDKSVLFEYRSLLETVEDEQITAILRKALPPVPKIIPVATFQEYLVYLPKWR
jgi:uncharacterized protein